MTKTLLLLGQKAHALCTDFRPTVSKRLSHQRRPATIKFKVNAVNSTQYAPAPAKKERSSILPLLSELTAIQSINIAFEELAGRTAMMGFFAATFAEALLPSRGLFGNFDNSFYFPFGLFLLSVSVALAASSTNRLGRRLLEAVIASLTSPTRSSGAITKTNVDSALDSAFDDVFSNAFLMRNLLFDELLVDNMTIDTEKDS